MLEPNKFAIAALLVLATKIFHDLQLFEHILIPLARKTSLRFVGSKTFHVDDILPSRTSLEMALMSTANF